MWTGFQCGGASHRVPLLGSFCLCYIFILFITTCSSLCCRICPPCLLAVCVESLKWQRCPYSHSQLHLNVTFNMNIFSCIWSCWLIPFFHGPIFVTCHLGWEIRDDTSPCLCFCVCAVNYRCAVNRHRQALKEWHHLSVIVTDISYACSDLWTEELAGEFGLYAVTQLISVMMVVGGLGII